MPKYSLGWKPQHHYRIDKMIGKILSLRRALVRMISTTAIKTKKTRFNLAVKGV